MVKTRNTSRLMKRIALLLMIGFFALGAQAQDDSTSTEKELKLPYKVRLKYADKLFKIGNYFEAMDQYILLTNAKPNNAYLFFQLGECHRLARDYKSAEKSYLEAIEKDAAVDDKVQFYLALMQKMNGKYSEAKVSFEKFTGSEGGNDEVAAYKRWAELEIKGCDLGMEYASNPKDYEITHLNAPLNKKKTEFAPYVVSESEMYYSSLNDDDALNGALMRDGKVLSHIYKSTKVNDEWTEGEPAAKPLNTSADHTGNTAITADGQRMYFTRCTAEGAADIRCEIYLSTLENGVWGKPKKLSEGVNAEDADNTQPAVAEGDGEYDILFFSSNRKSGKGGYDLYRSEVKYNGIASVPKNLSDLNTAGDEKTPYYWQRKSILFFSSNGHVNIGGFDIFSSKETAEGWTEVENLGAPINSSADDQYYSVGEDDRNIFYFVSNRPGIIGEKSETCCDDIFKAFNNFIPVFALNTKLMQDNRGEVAPLRGVKVEVWDITDGEPKLASSDSVVNAEDFFVDLKAERKYNIRYSMKDHFPEYVTINTVGVEESDTFSRDITLEKIIKNKAYRLAKIYYEYKSYDLTAESKVTLDTLYNLLMENEELVIELSSHTDSIGSHGYNLRLSQKRAESCVNYLKEKGIIEKRLIPRGYGETEPIAKNTNPDGTDNPEGRAENRRTEYKIIGELKNEGDKIILD